MRLALGITAVLVLVLGVFPGLVTALAEYSSQVLAATGL
jgi:hypothetical protein